ncbi:MAG: hypothetical protein WBE89_12460 [Methyloceanibacter sp.]
MVVVVMVMIPPRWIVMMVMVVMVIVVMMVMVVMVIVVMMVMIVNEFQVGILTRPRLTSRCNGCRVCHPQ